MVEHLQHSCRDLINSRRWRLDGTGTLRVHSFICNDSKGYWPSKPHGRVGQGMRRHSLNHAGLFEDLFGRRGWTQDPRGRDWRWSSNLLVLSNSHLPKNIRYTATPTTTSSTRGSLYCPVLIGARSHPPSGVPPLPLRPVELAWLSPVPHRGRSS